MSDHQFKLQINFTKAYAGEDNVAYIEGIASGPEVDLTGERMAPSALKSMVEALKKRLIEFRDVHHDEWNSDIGEVVELSLTEDNHLFYKAKLDLNLSGARDLWYRITKQGKKLGVSIGGGISKAGYEYVAELGRTVYTYVDVELTHIGVTRQAAYQHNFASAVLKSLSTKGHPMADELALPEVEETSTDTEEVTTDAGEVTPTNEETDVAAEEQSDATTTTESEVTEEVEKTEDAAEEDAEPEKSTTEEASDAEAESNDDTEAAEEESTESEPAADGTDDEVTKALTEAKEQSTQLQKALEDSTAKVEELTKSLSEKTGELTKAQKELAEKDAELEKINARKGIVFDKFPGSEVEKSKESAEDNSLFANFFITGAK